MAALFDNICKIAKNLEQDFNSLSGNIEHPVVKGSLREEILKEALEKIIPERYKIGSGLIVDALDNVSRQQDLFIYDALNSPVFHQTASIQILPVESVYACIEVKSTLSKKTLEDGLKNILSVKKLKKHLEQLNFHIPNEKGEPQQLVLNNTNYILGCIFAYSTDQSLDSLLKLLVEFNSDKKPEEMISTICVLNKGAIVAVNPDGNITTTVNDETVYQILENDLEQNLYFFYIYLNSHFNKTLNLRPDLWKYATVNQSFKDKGSKIPFDSMLDDKNYPVFKGSLSGRDLKRIQKYLKLSENFKSPIPTEEDAKRLGIPLQDLLNERSWVSKVLQENAFKNHNLDDSDL